MVKLIFYLILLLFLPNCSVDTKTGFWENKKDAKMNKKKSEIKFDNDLTFDQFKQNAIEYGKIGTFPTLDK